MRGLRLYSGALALALAASACAPARYLGSIGSDRTYVNRGYGLVAKLAVNGLLDRWEVVTHEGPDHVPLHLRPRLSSESLDLDGDGYLVLSERSQHTLPALRLLAKSSTTTVMDVDVEILGGDSKKIPLDALLALEVRQRAGTATVTAVREAIRTMQRVRVAPDWQGRVGEVDGPGRTHRIAVIDQPGFLAEEGITRRQMVRVILSAPALTDALRRDFDLLLSGLVLNTRGSPETNQEKW